MPAPHTEALTFTPSSASNSSLREHGSCEAASSSTSYPATKVGGLDWISTSLLQPGSATAVEGI